MCCDNLLLLSFVVLRVVEAAPRQDSGPDSEIKRGPTVLFIPLNLKQLGHFKLCIFTIFKVT